MKRIFVFAILLAVPACSDSSDDSSAPVNDDGGPDTSLADGSSPQPDTGTTPPKDGGADATTPGDAGSDAEPATDSGHETADASDSGITDAGDGSSDGEAVTDASDAGCPTTWFEAPEVDPSIAVPDGGGGVLLHALGAGTQDYKCVQSTTADGGTSYAWTLVTPDATLSDCHAAVVGHHFASEGGAGFPEWQTTDGTYVVGTKHLPTFTPDGGAGSVPWLLLTAVDAGGTGTLKQTQFVQRLNTDGGNAPATGCDSAHVGDTTDVGYTADYYFFGN